MRWRSESGQAVTENMAVISVLVIAIVGATYTFVPTFAGGVDELAHDAKQILTTGKISDAGTSRNAGGSGSNGGTLVNPPGRAPQMDGAPPMSSSSEGDTGTNAPGIPNLQHPDSNPRDSSSDPIRNGLGVAMPE